jgi:hypothetical protein
MHKAGGFMYATEIDLLNVEGVNLSNIHSWLGKLARKGYVVRRRIDGHRFEERTLYSVVKGKLEELQKERMERQNKVVKKVAKDLYAPDKPCASCKTAPRVHRSYCRKCLNEYNKKMAKKIYDRRKKERLNQGLEEYSL